jgi:hypothetical protein
MRNLRRLGAALLLTFILSCFAFAGDMETTIAGEMGTPVAGQMETTVAGEMQTPVAGWMDTGLTGWMDTTVALNILQSALSLF